MDHVIEIENLSKSFNGNRVLNKLSFHLNQNENIVLMAKSGGGKSVLLKIIVGLIEPDEGKVMVMGKEVTKLNEEGLIELHRQVGYLFQEGALYDSMTVGENIAFSLERQLRKKSSKAIDNIVKSTLEKLGLFEAVNKMPDELSGGMKKRVALARTLALQPSIILYDEPTAGLDPATSKEIIHLILEMKRSFGISGIIATHDLVCAKMASDRILFLHNGTIEAEGTFDSLEQSDNVHVKPFFL